MRLELTRIQHSDPTRAKNLETDLNVKKKNGWDQTLDPTLGTVPSLTLGSEPREKSGNGSERHEKNGSDQNLEKNRSYQT